MKKTLWCVLIAFLLLVGLSPQAFAQTPYLKNTTVPNETATFTKDDKSAAITMTVNRYEPRIVATTGSRTLSVKPNDFISSLSAQALANSVSGLPILDNYSNVLLSIGDGFQKYSSSNLTFVTFYHKASGKLYYYIPSENSFEPLPKAGEVNAYNTSKIPLIVWQRTPAAKTSQNTTQPSSTNTTAVDLEKKCASNYTGYTATTRNPMLYSLYRTTVCRITTAGTQTGTTSTTQPSATPTPKTDPAAGTPTPGQTTNRGTDFDKLPNPLGGAGIVDINTGISKVMNLVLMVAIPFVVIMIMYSGFLFIAAYGNPGKLEKARSTLLWTLVGTALLLGATTIGTAIVNTVKKIGGGTTQTTKK